MVEYWNVDLNKEVTHLLMRLRRINPLSRGISPILHLLEPIIPWPRPLAQTWHGKMRQWKVSHS